MWIMIIRSYCIHRVDAAYCYMCRMSRWSVHFSVCCAHRVSPAKTAEQIQVPFWEHAVLCGPQPSWTMHALDEGGHWRHLANMTEWSVRGGDVPLWQINLTNCYLTVQTVQDSCRLSPSQFTLRTHASCLRCVCCKVYWHCPQGLCNGTVSAPLSVCPSMGPQQQTRCCRLLELWARRAEDIGRLLHGRCSAASECGQCHVVSVYIESWTQTCCYSTVA